MKRPIAPCKDCDDRTIGCHIICDKYINYAHAMEIFREEKNRIAEENRIQKDIENRWKHLVATGQIYKRKRK